MRHTFVSLGLAANYQPADAASRCPANARCKQITGPGYTTLASQLRVAAQHKAPRNELHEQVLGELELAAKGVVYQEQHLGAHHDLQARADWCSRTDSQQV